MTRLDRESLKLGDMTELCAGKVGQNCAFLAEELSRNSYLPNQIDELKTSAAYKKRRPNLFTKYRFSIFTREQAFL